MRNDKSPGDDKILGDDKGPADDENTGDDDSSGYVQRWSPISLRFCCPSALPRVWLSDILPSLLKDSHKLAQVGFLSLASKRILML